MGEFAAGGFAAGAFAAGAFGFAGTSPTVCSVGEIRAIYCQDIQS